jgi:tRNA(fMet)-specific endonuclease VapC
MNYVLDTDTMIYFLQGKEIVVQRILQIPINRLHTTIINRTELFYGAYNSTRKDKNLEKISSFLKTFKILPFCEDSSLIFAKTKASLKTDGNIIADMDLMIASICIQYDMILVTNNEKHFSRIKKLKIDNWSNES